MADCKYDVEGSDLVPYGSGDIEMPCHDCNYDGDKWEEVEEYAYCDEKCPGYTPIEKVTKEESV